MSADGSFAFAEAPSPEELARFPLNDFGNAMRLVRLVGGAIGDDGRVEIRAARLLYLRERGWIAFNGVYWDLRDGEALARRWAHQVAAGLIAQGEAFQARGLTGAVIAKFVTAAGNAGASSAMLAQAQSYLGADLTDFDPDPMALNVANGVLRFRRDRKGKPRCDFTPGHDPADRMTRLAPVAWSPGALRPLWDAHCAFCHRSRAMRAYLQKCLGYTITGDVDEQIFLILQGKGGDGKSTLVNALREVAGTYAVSAGVETFLDSGVKRAAEASPDIARLSGDSRLICVSEPPRGSKLASSAIKSFTGGAPVAARELRQGIFEFQPAGKVVMECNAKPNINDTDDGIWRRVRVIMFRHQVAEADKDRHLGKKLKGEYPGILNWVVEGVLAWMDEGLTPPAEVLETLDDYRRGSNPFSGWVAERVALEPAAETPSKELYASYKAWCDDEGHDRPMSVTAFGRALGDMQVIARKKNGIKVRVGARLRGQFEEAPAARPPEADAEIAEPGALDVSAEDWEADS